MLWIPKLCPNQNIIEILTSKCCEKYWMGTKARTLVCRERNQRLTLGTFRWNKDTRAGGRPMSFWEFSLGQDANPPCTCSDAINGAHVTTTGELRLTPSVGQTQPAKQWKVALLCLDRHDLLASLKVKGQTPEGSLMNFTGRPLYRGCLLDLPTEISGEKWNQLSSKRLECRLNHCLCQVWLYFNAVEVISEGKTELWKQVWT